MAQTNINERLKFLIEALGMSARAFSAAIGSGDTNTRNYLDRGSKPGADYLEKIMRRFETVNSAWLITGDGEPFLPGAPAPGTLTQTQKKNRQSQKGSQGNFIQTNHGVISYSIADCEKERDTYKASVESYKKEVELLREQLAMKDTVIAAKDQTIDLLKEKAGRSN
ncbi:transcriptional regulator [Hymenobacter sp. PAMC 26628]|uniref:transcriptional regulator n=1 Tax=Hymenobacter sp. PAMC 26628 TaxID=1484118 RepID=UPI00077031AC|nr:transcriptional regulator [Hymenobacter sp. PAMC 26628]AMJ65923.1 hypothetical protein AXW84_11150 [Hymenobacter sp. PAMC 26628]